MNFFIKKQNVSEAIARGITFELCYANALIDSQKRRYFLTNAIALAEACNGKNLIISSEATDPMLRRSPADVRAISSLLDLAEKHQDTLLSSNCENALNHCSIWQ